MKSFVRTSSRILEGIAMLFLVTLFLCVLTQIVMRNFFNSGSVILEELARISLVSLVFIMIPVILVNRQHIVVDLVTSRLSGKASHILQIVVEILTLALSVFLLLSANQVLTKNWSVVTPAMKMPNSILYIPIVVGILFTALESISFIINLVRGKERIV